MHVGAPPVGKRHNAVTPELEDFTQIELG